MYCNYCCDISKFISGGCDHLELYPVYSGMQHHNFTLTTWNKPWPPEIDFLNSYVNLSSYHPIILEALTTGFRITKYAKYFSNTEFGCILKFPMDPDLADAYYLEHYSDTNNTVYVCTPNIPVTPHLRRRFVELFPNKYSMVMCFVYKLGSIKRLYQQSIPINVRNDQRIFILVAAVITFIGVGGEYS